MARKTQHPKPIAASTGARDAILAALPDRTAETGVTARELAEATGVRYSTVTEQLRALAAEGIATSTRAGASTLWRFGSDATPEPAEAGAKPARRSEVSDVRGFMEQVRPVSPAPAGAAGDRQPRERSERALAAGYATTWERGGLRDAVLGFLRSLRDEEGRTPVVVAKALHAQVGSVAAAMDAMVKRGEVKLTADKPKTYAAV